MEPRRFYNQKGRDTMNTSTRVVWYQDTAEYAIIPLDADREHERRGGYQVMINTDHPDNAGNPIHLAYEAMRDEGLDVTPPPDYPMDGRHS